ncbi:sigma-70 family RNA polymerase sigma factor [Myxococcaceae bacterium JPH2]|nr:sigma-70 family RNA polymerase sigma factor [Myxococcaceae bacterium JPH2]
MGSPSDEALMEEFRAGQLDAFEVLFARHSRRVHGFLARMVRDGPLAEDLLQTTFLSVIRARGRFEPGTRFAPWLLTIAANAARDALKHQRHVHAYVQERPRGPGTPADSSDAWEVRHQLEDALQQLPPEQREAVVLSKIEGWSFEEIAELRGISAGAARLRAHRGYERLRSLLGEMETV